MVPHTLPFNRKAFQYLILNATPSLGAMNEKKNVKTSQAMLSFILNFLFMLCEFVLWFACKKSRSSKATDLNKILLEMQTLLRFDSSFLLFVKCTSVYFHLFSSVPFFILFQFGLRTHWILRRFIVGRQMWILLINPITEQWVLLEYECNDGIWTLLFKTY